MYMYTYSENKTVMYILFVVVVVLHCLSRLKWCVFWYLYLGTNPLLRSLSGRTKR